MSSILHLAARGYWKAACDAFYTHNDPVRGVELSRCAWFCQYGPDGRVRRPGEEERFAEIGRGISEEDARVYSASALVNVASMFLQSGMRMPQEVTA
jgi:hypothetical protein